MSTLARWIVPVLLVLAGLGAAAFAVLGGAFSTIACVQSSPDWVYYVLLVAGMLTMAAAIVPAVLLVRRARAIQLILALVAGVVFSCRGYGAYMAALGTSC